MAKYDKETKFYWLQLKEDFFDEDVIDWLLEQDNGEKYAIFYLRLCLKSLKTNGILVRNVGKLLIPYDNNKLAELTKTDVDTVIVAMEILKNLGLVQVLENGELYMTQLENMIGSQSKGAFKKQQQLQRKKQELLQGGIIAEKIPPKIEIELELEQEKEIDIKQENNKRKKFVKPSLEEVQQYCNERNNNINAEHFIDYYEANGWKVGKNPMKDWKAAIRTWEKRDNKTTKRKEIVPDWLNKDIKSEAPNKEQEKELEEIVKSFNPELEERVNKLKERLNS